MLYNMSDKDILLMPYAARRKLQLDIASIVSTISNVVTIVTAPDGITFNSFELSLSLVSGGSITINASYSLTIKGGSPISDTFSYSPNSNKTGRHLLESGGGLKDMVIKELIKAVISYIKKAYPIVGALLPKTDCADSKGNIVA